MGQRVTIAASETKAVNLTRIKMLAMLQGMIMQIFVTIACLAPVPQPLYTSVPQTLMNAPLSQNLRKLKS